MAVTITPLSLRVKSTTLLNTDIEYPTAAKFPEQFSRADMYLMHSAKTNTWGLLLGLPVALATLSKSIYWYDAVLSTSTALMDEVIQAGFQSKLFIAYKGSAVDYSPSVDSEFTSAAIVDGIYVHLYNVGSGYWKAVITDHLGNTWDETTKTFSIVGFIVSTPLPSQVYTNSTSTLPLSEVCNGKHWFPSLATGVTLLNTGTAEYTTYTVVTVPTAQEINAHKTSTHTGHILPLNLGETVYITEDTFEMVFMLPTITQLVQGTDSGNVVFLPVKTGSDPVSTGSVPPIMVKLTPVTQQDKDAILNIATTYTEVVIGVGINKLSVDGGFSATLPSIVIDKTVAGFKGYMSSDSDGISTYYGTPAYVIDPNEQTYPLMSLRMVRLPYARAERPLVTISSPPAFDVYYTGGSTLSSSQSGTEYVLPVKGQYGWSAVQKAFDLTDVGVTSYRLTFTPQSPLTASILQSTSAAMSLKVGMYNCAPVDVSTKYRANSSAPDLHTSEWVPFFFVEVSKVANTVTVTKYIPIATGYPFLATNETKQNLSGQTIDWSGTTQVDMIVTKTSATMGTLIVYLNRNQAAIFTVPWIDQGHAIWFGTNSVTYTSTTAMFTLTNPLETVNATEPFNGLIVPPPPTVHEFIEITTKAVTQAPTVTMTNPYCIYVHTKGATIDVYIPLVVQPNTYTPTGFAVLRNLPYGSGVVFDMLTNNQWYNGAQLHSFIIDTTDDQQFPSTAAYGNPGFLFVHNPPVGATYQVTIRTGNNWATVLGTYTAEVVPSLSTYLTNPYPVLGGDALERLSTAYVHNAVNVSMTDTAVTLKSLTGTVAGAAVGLAFSSTDSKVWTFSFTRASIGAYDEGYFDVILSSVRHDHVLDYNSSDTVMNLVPYPHKESVRVRFTNDGNVYPVVQVSNPTKFEYSSPMSLTTGKELSSYDGTKRIRIALEKVGMSCMLYVYEDDTFIASAVVPVTWMFSGSVLLSHFNTLDSTEIVGNLQFASGKTWLGTVDTRPLIMTPVIHRSNQLITEPNVDTLVYQLEQDCKYAYADIYVRNNTTVTQTVTLTIGTIDPMYMVNNKQVSPGDTLVLRSKQIVTGERITVKTSSRLFVRVACVCELI